MKTVVIVLDSLGVGAMPDAPKFGDSLSVNTLACVLSMIDSPSQLSTLESLGFLNLRKKTYHSSCAILGKCAEASNGKDTVVGHWELCGIISETAFPSFPNGFPESMINVIKKISGKGVLGNKPASGTKIIEELGQQHMVSGDLIVYTSSDSVLQIAAHESIVPVEELYKICSSLRKQFVKPEEKVNRIIARPFIGDYQKGFSRTNRRRDFTVPTPNDNILVDLLREQIPVYAIGKIGDIFSNINFTDKIKTEDNADGMSKTLECVKKIDSGMIFTNLVDFDMKYGHRRNVKGYANALIEFDKWLKMLMDNLSKDDFLLLTADHGCDPCASGTDHTREYIPILLWSSSFKKGVVLKDRDTYADIAATIADIFKLKSYSGKGESFYKAILQAQS